jgi:hypothetical protein
MGNERSAVYRNSGENALWWTFSRLSSQRGAFFGSSEKQS